MLLVCFAVKEEAAYAWPLPVEAGGREILVTGMGRKNALTHIRAALVRCKPERVLTCGFAGGLDPALTVGTVVFDEDFDAGFGKDLLELGAVQVTFHCARRVAVTAAEKAELRRTTEADAIEMESSVIRVVCREHGIPSATVRVISDAANEDLPLDFNAVMTSDQRISVTKLAGALLRSPRAVPNLLALQRNTRLAARRLGEVLTKLLRCPDCA